MKVIGLFTVLCVLAVFPLAAGGGQSNAPRGSVANSAAIVTRPGQLPIVTQPVTFKVGLRQSPHVENYDTNNLTLWLEKQTGIKTNFQVFSTVVADSNTQFELMVSAGEKLPDVMLFAPGDWMLHGDNGVFVDLNPYYRDWAYFYNERVNSPNVPASEKLRIEMKSTAPSGKRYAYSMYSQQANMPYQGMNFINQKWLTALRLQMPRTTEDFYNVLVAFRDRNPTGTGVATIPWVGAFMTGGNPLEFIINAFVYHPYRDHNNFYLNATDGKLWTPWTTEEYREALRYLNRLYSEGLLHASTFTNTQPELAAIVTYQPNETGRVGFFSGNMTQVLLPETPGVFDFTFQQPLTGPKNVSYYPMIPHRVVPSSFITRDCAYPEAAFRWLDYFSDKDACLISRQGEKDVDWRWLTPAELPTAKTYFGSPAIIQQINVTWATMGNKHWNIEPAQMYVEHETTVMTRWTDDGTFVANRYKMYQTYVDRVGPNRDVPEKVEDILYTAAELNQIREIRTSIDTYREESLALFITGQLSPDRDWANYLSTLDRMGLQRYLDIAQRAYTRTLEVIRK